MNILYFVYIQGLEPRLSLLFSHFVVNLIAAINVHLVFSFLKKKQKNKATDLHIRFVMNILLICLVLAGSDYFLFSPAEK